MLTGRPGGVAAENLRVVEEKLREEKRRAAAAGNGFQSSLFAAHALEARTLASGSRAAARRVMPPLCLRRHRYPHLDVG